MPWSMSGAPSTCTEAGPPERMIAFGRRARMSATGVVRGTISLYTCASRTRLAISCAYWAPKSTTRTRSGASVTLDSAGHADALGALQRLALGLQRGRDHDLGLLEFLDRLVAGRRHRRSQRAEEVERPVVLVRGTDHDLGEGGLLTRQHTRPARQRGMERRHSPVVAASR